MRHRLLAATIAALAVLASSGAAASAAQLPVIYNGLLGYAKGCFDDVNGHFGHVDGRFEPVREAFAANFERRIFHPTVGGPDESDADSKQQSADQQWQSLSDRQARE